MLLIKLIFSFLYNVLITIIIIFSPSKKVDYNMLFIYYFFFLIFLSLLKLKTSPAGLEPALPKGNGLAGHRVNHSAKVTLLSNNNKE